VGRIVVNFEPGKGSTAAQPKRRRRWPKILAIFAICVVVLIGVIAIAGFFFWRRFQASPEYSLTLLVDAAQRNRTEELSKLIDDDEIAKNMIGTVSQKAAGRYGVAMTPATQQQIDKVMSSALPRVKQTIHDEVAKAISRLALKAADKPFVYLLLTVPSLVKITTEGDTAKGSATVDGRPIELTLRRDADRWKVVAFNDDALVQKIVDSMMKELPPIGAFDSDNPLFKNPGKSRKKRK
jgi:hypothetical protein